MTVCNTIHNTSMICRNCRKVYAPQSCTDDENYPYIALQTRDLYSQGHNFSLGVYVQLQCYPDFIYILPASKTSRSN